MNAVAILRWVEPAHKDFDGGPIFKLLELICSFQEDATGLNFVHLADKWNIIVEVRVERIASKVHQSL